MWEKLRADIKLAFWTMLRVTPHCIVVVSNLEEMIVDEIEMQLRGYIAAKHTS